MRITSSGNLLVGKTSTGYNSGTEISYEDFIRVNRTNGSALYVGRNSSDGELVSFRKDGTTVGSIGTKSGNLFIGSTNGSDGHLTFGSNIVFPANSNGDAKSDAIDLGASCGRFKDAHFSGTVNAANFNTTSDATLKTNVETLTGSLDKVKALRGVSYDWIESGGSEIGVSPKRLKQLSLM